MSFEQLAHRYEPKTYKQFYLPQDWHHKPGQLSHTLDTIIQNGLDVLSHDDMTAEFTFRMPQEAHVLPLFQHQLFTTLVKEHNEWNETKYYIDPFTLMILDPALGRLSRKPSLLFKSIPGEDIMLHELRHFWGLEELWGRDAKGELGIELMWKDNPKNDIQFLSIEGYFGTYEDTNGQDGLTTSSRPLYPSSSDLKMILEELKRIKHIGTIKRKYLWDKLTSDKLMEQGLRFRPLGFFVDPVSPDLMLGSLFTQWHDLRKNDIDFSKWDGVLKYK